MATSTATHPRPRSADPYADTAVIDARAPRFNQATVGIVSVVALLTGWWWLLGLLAVQLLVGLALGRRWCLPCVLYFEVVQPRIGEGRVEDARPPRFANQLGATFLTAATLADLAGVRPLGTALGGIVAALALLAAATGLCVGCEAYRLLARARGVRRGSVGAVDLPGLGAAAAPETVVQFTHPLCSDCHELAARLRAEPRPLVTVDVSERPDLARRYHVTVVPTAFAVAADGTVLRRIA
jgi:Domain of unknown function (DUF4395)